MNDDLVGQPVDYRAKAELRAELRREHGPRFTACERLLTIAADLCSTNAGSLVHDGNVSTTAVAALFAKGWKTLQAILVLAEEGYGEDAMILARSLAGLLIDLSYVAADVPDRAERAEDWRAVGLLARHGFARTFNRLAEVSQEELEEWRRRDQRWRRKVGIWGRATAAGNEMVYNLAYRHGSSFEHSDASIARFYGRRSASGMEWNTRPGDRFVWHALTLGAFIFVKIIIAWGGYFRCDLCEAHARMKAVFREGFGVEVPDGS